jgi:hypothetical protein
MTAARKAAEIEQNGMRNYYGIPGANYSVARNAVKNEDWFK